MTSKPLTTKKSITSLFQLSISEPLSMSEERQLEHARTAEERRLEHTRTAEAAQAKLRSDRIDSEIKAEKKQKRKLDGPKILLLGQSNSGKSTVLKNFQHHFAPRVFAMETELWRPVIHLNLVSCVSLIVEDMLSRSSKSSGLKTFCENLAHRSREIEVELKELLKGIQEPGFNARRRALWRDAYATEPQPPPAPIHWRDSTTRTKLDALGNSMVTLLNNPSVHTLFNSARINIYSDPGSLFLDDIARITRQDYIPEQNIMRARFPTTVPEEYIIISEHGTDAYKYWTIIDVGGSQTRGVKWADYFEHVNMMIFVVSMSGFNEGLEKNPEINKLDSFKTWEMLCSNKHLSRMKFVLFLNKKDLFQNLIGSGISYARFDRKYEGPNEVFVISRYLKDSFASIYQKCSTSGNHVWPHITCAIEIGSLSNIITELKESIRARAADVNTI